MEVVCARALADGLELVCNACVCQHEAVGLHVRVGGASPGFDISCVRAVRHISQDMDPVDPKKSLGGHLAFLGASVERYSSDDRGFRLWVVGAPDLEARIVQVGPAGRSVIASRLVEKIRARVESLALVHEEVAWTVYDASTRRFVFKSPRRDTSLSRALEFFGGVDAELVVPLDDGTVSDGWRVLGHAVLPPVGHPSRSRQRVYVNGVSVGGLSGGHGDGGLDTASNGASLHERIESIYRDACAGAIRQLPTSFGPNAGQLGVVRRRLNAYPMFILDISMANMDARREDRAAGDIGDAQKRSDKLSMLSLPDAVAAIERAFLQAWSKTLTGRLLKLLEAASRQVHAEDTSTNEHRIVRVDTRRARRRFGGVDGPGPRDDDHDDTPGVEDAGAHVDRRPSLFDEFDDPKAFQCASRGEFRVNDGAADDLDPPSPLLPKRRRSLAGRLAINAILDAKAAPQESTASTALLMPHTAAHSTFANPVVLASSLQSAQPPVTRHDLANAALILGQIERKFIAFVTPPGPNECSKLVIIDQHAADERVRLEHLSRLAILPGTNRPNRTHVHTQALAAPTHLHVGTDEEALFRTYRSDAYAWGWQWEHRDFRDRAEVDRVESGTGRIGHHQRTVVTHVPVLFGRLLSAADLKLYLYELASVGCKGSASATGSVVPDAVRRALASLACRSAIMFGDHVSNAAATTLVSDLSRTKQYTECAHGRPTVACLWRWRDGTRGARDRPGGLQSHQTSMSLSDLRNKLVFETI